MATLYLIPLYLYTLIPLYPLHLPVQYRKRYPADAHQFVFIADDSDLPHLRFFSDVNRFGYSLHVPTPDAADVIAVDFETHAVLAIHVDAEGRGHASHSFRQSKRRATVQQA